MGEQINRNQSQLSRSIDVHFIRIVSNQTRTTKPTKPVDWLYSGNDRNKMNSKEMSKLINVLRKT